MSVKKQNKKDAPDPQRPDKPPDVPNEERGIARFLSAKNLAAATLFLIGLIFLLMSLVYIVGSYFLGESMKPVAIINACFWSPLFGVILIALGYRLWKKPNIRAGLSDEEIDRLADDDQDTVKAIGCFKLLVIVLLAIAVIPIGNWLWPKNTDRNPDWREYKEIDGRLISTKYPFSVAALPEEWQEQQPPESTTTMYFTATNAQISVMVSQNESVDDCLRLLTYLTTSEGDLIFSVMDRTEQIFGLVPGCTATASVSPISPAQGEIVSFFNSVSILIDHNDAYIFAYMYGNKQDDEPTKGLRYLPVFENFVNSYRSEP